jgi:hypothetical protein
MTRQFRIPLNFFFLAPVILSLMTFSKFSRAEAPNAYCDSYPKGGIKELPSAILDGLFKSGTCYPNYTPNPKSSGNPGVIATCKWADPSVKSACPPVTLLLQAADGSGLVQPSSFEEHWDLFPPDDKVYSLVIVSSRYRLIGTYQIQRGHAVEVQIESIPTPVEKK